jgi:hypothetical protein
MDLKNRSAEGMGVLSQDLLLEALKMDFHHFQKTLPSPKLAD